MNETESKKKLDKFVIVAVYGFVMHSNENCYFDWIGTWHLPLTLLTLFRSKIIRQFYNLKTVLVCIEEQRCIVHSEEEAYCWPWLLHQFHSGIELQSRKSLTFPNDVKIVCEPFHASHRLRAEMLRLWNSMSCLWVILELLKSKMKNSQITSGLKVGLSHSKRVKIEHLTFEQRITKYKNASFSIHSINISGASTLYSEWGRRRSK